MSDVEPRGRPPGERDRITVRRAVCAGLLVWAALGAVLVTVVVRAGGDGAAGLVAVMVGLVAGSLVASTWLLLAAAADLVADEPPGRRRTLWTIAVMVFTFASPLLLAAAQAAR